MKNKAQTPQLNILAVMGSFKTKLQERLANVKENQTLDEWHDDMCWEHMF